MFFKKALKISLVTSLAVVSIFASGSLASANGPREEASSVATYDRLARVELGLLPVTSKKTSAYSRVRVDYGGERLTSSALRIGTRTYVALADIADGIGATLTYDRSTKVATMRYPSLTLTVGDGAYVTYANDRPIFSFSNSVVMSDGRLYMPIDSVAKALGLTVRAAGSTVTLSGNIRPMNARRPYTEDEIFWLARIIQAESSGESLLGKIGVGGVVMNRVRSPLYPNTIYGVIFDRKYGVQFSPVLNGTIYNTPNYQSRLAAMICLEGFSISDDALFFLEPNISTSSWIPKNRRYLFSILHHDFYA